MVQDEDEEDEEEETQCKRRKYQNILMLSEWMVDIPSDLTSNWYLFICPIAKRCSVIASHGKTQVFARNGYKFMYEFQSSLPGGSKLSASSSNHCALDCLYESKSKTFYILDPIVWNGASFYGTDTQFRDYWLASRITDELSESLNKVNNYNRYRMKILPRVKCNFEYLSRVINNMKEETSSCTCRCERKKKNLMMMQVCDKEENKYLVNEMQEKNFQEGTSLNETKDEKEVEQEEERSLCGNCSVDGLLFVHCMTLYTPGVNPLANWLKPDMCEQLLTKVSSNVTIEQ